MATWNGVGDTFTTTAGNKTVSSAAAGIGDLIVVVSMCSGTGNTQAITDDNAGGGGTYTEVVTTSAGPTDGVNGKRLRCWVRNSLIAATGTTIYTNTITADTGGGLRVMRLSGMTRTGAAALRQGAFLSSQTAATTPTVTLGAAALTENPLIGAVVNASNFANVTPRGSPVWTEPTDTGWNTPTSGIEVMVISSGETASSIAWGSTSATAYGVFVAELDTSALAAAAFITRPRRVWRPTPGGWWG
jgi:hypothetical protein